ncbi:hypothetical protein AGLY_006795 [Aphis glycines]|uniref:Uncharacterized protein n=1 Tax=Aphis glycines TaxID=307491 RepID=A0A6G0TQU4_APHGL|nr:hypothetical protein AGLY_006795 [Aphis glycines]
MTHLYIDVTIETTVGGLISCGLNASVDIPLHASSVTIIQENVFSLDTDSVFSLPANYSYQKMIDGNMSVVAFSSFLFSDHFQMKTWLNTRKEYTCKLFHTECKKRMKNIDSFNDQNLPESHRVVVRDIFKINSGYNFIKKKKNDILPLPSPRTLSRYLSVIDFSNDVEHNFPKASTIEDKANMALAFMFQPICDNYTRPVAVFASR